MSLDHGFLNLSLSKRYGRGGIDAEIDRQMAAQRRADEAAERERRIARKAAQYAEKVRPKLTAEDVRGAAFVRDRWGWHRVVRVNTKSVTVETEHSWTDRIPLDRILEVRR